MGKPFEISYTPEQFDPATGGAMPGAYGGINVEQPENVMGPQFFPQLDDFILRNQEIRSRPSFTSSFIPAPDTNIIQAVIPAFGPNANSTGAYTIKLVAVTAGGLYRWDGAAWHQVFQSNVGVAGAIAPFVPVSWRIFQNVLYLSNGNPYLISWDGVSDTDLVISSANIGQVGPFILTAVDGAGNYTGVITGGAANAYAGVRFSILGFNNAGNNLVNAVATASTATSLSFGGVTTAEIHAAAAFGGITIGAQFIDELDNHLVMANTNESGVLTPWRVRWSANGLPMQWDPTVNVNAGLADFLEVTDQITGTIMMGRVGYILRSNGITEISPTGNGVAPFDFNHLWASQVGLGNILPEAVGVFGPAGMIVANENIYQIQASGFAPVGGMARDAIMGDIGVQPPSASTANGGPAVIGFLTPYLVGQQAISAVPNTTSFQSFPYMTYMLFMRVNDQNTRVWVYSMEDKNWVRWTLPDFWVTGKPCIALAGSLAGNAVMVIPWASEHGSPNLGIGVFVTNNFNDPNQPSSYSYRVEDVEINRYPTVRRIILTYRDLGTATITVTVTGTNDNGAVVSKAQTVTIGNAIPTNVLITKFVDIALSAFRPQLSINRAANAGPVSITRATMLGTSEEVTL